MRLVLLAAALALCPTMAIAQTCYTYGDVVTCSNGAAAYRYGNAALFDDSSRNVPRHGTLMYWGWGSAYSGNSTVFSNGRTGYTSDNTTVMNNGRSCHRYGDSLVCNHAYRGLAPSYTRPRR